MALCRRPPDGQWARTGTVDSSIVRFLLPIGGAALLRLPWRLPFHINGHVLPDTTKIENGIIPPPPRRAMGPDRNCRQLNCPVPIAHRGGGSAEVALEAAFSYKDSQWLRISRYEFSHKFVMGQRIINGGGIASFLYSIFVFFPAGGRGVVCPGHPDVTG